MRFLQNGFLNHGESEAEADGKRYLSKYPHLLKWINQCVACQRRGYRPELPPEIFPGIAARNLRKYFDELPVSEKGLCLQRAHDNHKGERSCSGMAR